jgi:hypothetical protein
MTQTNLAVPSVVLVHAAWADASSWNKVIPSLQRRSSFPPSPEIPGVDGEIRYEVSRILPAA